MAPKFIYGLATGQDVSGPEAGAATSVVAILVQLFLGYFLTAALVYGTIRELRGSRANLGECVGRGLALVFPVIGVAFVAFIAGALGFLLLIVPGLIVVTMLWVAIPAAVVERPGVIRSLGRSRELTKGSRWRVFGIIVILFVIEVLPTGVVDALLGATGNLTAYLVVSWLVTAFVMAFSAVVAAVGYHDLRVAKEGVDVEQIAAVFD